MKVVFPAPIFEYFLPRRGQLGTQLSSLIPNPSPSILLFGGPGSGKLKGAIALGTALLCPDGGCGTCKVCTSAINGHHPDLDIFRRSAGSLSVTDAKSMVALSLRKPSRGERRILIMTEMHLLERAGPVLLKSIEEPPTTTTFILTAEAMTNELVPIASRCLRIDFSPPAQTDVMAFLMKLGAERETAERISAIAGARLDRAEMYFKDPEAELRRDLYHRIPLRLAKDAVLLSELATELEGAGGKAAVKSKGRKKVGTTTEESTSATNRATRAEEIRAGLEVLLASYTSLVVSGERWDLRFRMEEISSAVMKASRSLSRNCSEAIVLRELLFELAYVTSEMGK